MGACRIQYVLLLSLLGFSPCSDTLTCHKGIMVKLGNGFSKTAVGWKSFGTTEPAPNSICQETLLIIDVGEKSLILASKGSSHPGSNNSLDVQVFSAGPGIVAASYAHFCVTDLCNNANSSSVLLDSLSLPDSELGTTQCPVCLHFRGSCAQHTAFVVCPKGTHCYLSDMTVEGGGVNAAFSLDGCLSDFATNVLKGQTSIGIFSAMEASDSHSSVSSSRVLVPSPLLAWMFGLSPLLSPLFAEICPLS
ncbi:CD177 antigen-like isoform X2 [Apodemus sylvaticus]|uniref:CD177 antigen-like isoform X2 n=1 Tax=Apodemus sylvaticus TaxID=10129 RepID=UPI0022426AC9|nr:CD177 antigen-like isoform X2 [Apodemus sylvaticus]